VDAVVYRYGPISDSGVELERTTDGKVAWRVYVEPLGIEHSKYRHEVTVRVEGERVDPAARGAGALARSTPPRITVESVGARRIVEVRDLATGRQVSREVTDLPR
jgi:hypothetical protein